VHWNICLTPDPLTHLLLKNLEALGELHKPTGTFWAHFYGGKEIELEGAYKDEHKAGDCEENSHAQKQQDCDDTKNIYQHS
jgi:hypothetical protein